jgi:hypothetical protein
LQEKRVSKLQEKRGPKAAREERVCKRKEDMIARVKVEIEERAKVARMREGQSCKKTGRARLQETGELAGRINVVTDRRAKVV